MLFPESSIAQMQKTSTASMEDDVRIYTPGTAGGFGEDPASDTNHYNGKGHVQDGRAAVIRERSGDSEIDANAIVRVPLSATVEVDKHIESTYGPTGYRITRTGRIKETDRGHTAIWLFVKWSTL